MNTIVVAYDRLHTIGLGNTLPWQGRLPADMAHFKIITEGQSVVMGRRTFESLPEAYRPLPNRHNIVMSLSLRAMDGITVVSNLEDAYRAASQDACVIGGAQIYEQALEHTDRIFATEIDTAITDGDAFFPALDQREWEKTEHDTFDADDKNAFAYSFVTYTRRGQ